MNLGGRGKRVVKRTVTRITKENIQPLEGGRCAGIKRKRGEDKRAANVVLTERSSLS